MPGTDAKPVMNFLDAVDLVINSNTFLLHTRLLTPNIKAEFTRFISSADFLTQILQQDIGRGWHNMHFFTDEDEQPAVRPGELVKDHFDLIFREAPASPKEYLMAMLTANSRFGNFRSYYSKEKMPAEAQVLVDDFLGDLFAGRQVELYIIEPDFLVSGGEDPEPDLDKISYFEGLRGSDSATALVCGEDAYLLLTNGIP